MLGFYLIPFVNLVFSLVEFFRSFAEMQLMLFEFILKMGSKIGVSCYPAKIKKYKS